MNAASGVQIKVGDVFPPLSGFKLEGTVPDNLKGKVILVDFWASWCAPCKASFPVMDELTKKYAPKGFAVLAVNVDEKKKDMEKFMGKQSVAFAVVRDAEQKLVARVNVETMPTSLLIDREGTVRFIHNGFHGDETRKKYEEEIEQLVSK